VRNSFLSRVLIVALLAGLSPACSSKTVSQAQRQPDIDQSKLTKRLEEISKRASGVVGVMAIHVESGKSAALDSTKKLVLQSVFKMALAVTVLKAVEEKRISLDQKLLVTPDDVAPGSKYNTDLWRKPAERSVQELLELSISRSDNTSSDKLLKLIGGPNAVTAQMRSLGFQNIDVNSTTRELSTGNAKPNLGSAEDFANLLLRIQKGEILQREASSLLIGFMERATTGLKRIRGDLPAGTIVADKTGSGEANVATNDIGIITLPNGRGHVAIAVLINGSGVSIEAQEKVIAELARAAYDEFLAQGNV